MRNYTKKYLKYKSKYFELKQEIQTGGSWRWNHLKGSWEYVGNSALPIDNTYPDRDPSKPFTIIQPKGGINSPLYHDYGNLLFQYIIFMAERLNRLESADEAALKILQDIGDGVDATGSELKDADGHHFTGEEYLRGQRKISKTGESLEGLQYPELFHKGKIESNHIEQRPILKGKGQRQTYLSKKQIQRILIYSVSLAKKLDELQQTRNHHQIELLTLLRDTSLEYQLGNRPPFLPDNTDTSRTVREHNDIIGFIDAAARLITSTDPEAARIYNTGTWPEGSLMSDLGSLQRRQESNKLAKQRWNEVLKWSRERAHLESARKKKAAEDGDVSARHHSNKLWTKRLSIPSGQTSDYSDRPDSAQQRNHAPNQDPVNSSLLSFHMHHEDKNDFDKSKSNDYDDTDYDLRNDGPTSRSVQEEEEEERKEDDEGQDAFFDNWQKG